MVNRILSLQLVFTLAASPAWAISGGPYDQYMSLAAMTGTYGVSLSGTNPDHLSSTGVMLLSVPSKGLAQASTLVFDQGLIFAGSATGAVNISGEKGTIKMVSQLTHYSVRTTTDGGSATTVAFPDSMLNGFMNLKIAPDYQSGLVSVGGAASYWEVRIRLRSTESVTESVTETDNGNGSRTTTTTTTTTRTTKAEDGNRGVDNVEDDPISTDLGGQTLIMALDGVRQSNLPTAITRFTAPGAETNWGVGPNANGS